MKKGVFEDFKTFSAEHEFIPMRELIYQYLREAIITGNLPPGIHLVEEEVAKRLNVSRTPVREALRKLESEGLVKHHRRRGVEVRQISTKDATDIYELSSVLEGYATRLMSERSNLEDMEHLRKILYEMKKGIDAGNEDLEMNLHQKWHFTIYEACNNKRVEKLLKNYTDYLQLFRAYSIQVPGRWKQTWEEHEQIFKAIETGDGNLAELVAREHVAMGKEAFVWIWQRKLNEIPDLDLSDFT